MSGTSAWRVAGLSYVKYVEISSKALRQCVKEEAKKKFKTHDLQMKERTFTNGVPSEKVEIADSFAASIFKK
eukprot:CAMPEP_0171508954 /NCGR_PEP_ID=MMETSP0958-20121227/14484_1 /TAXON_ID=87120 /ORGANISM="Aurantiochytrium limacinum, Strain ATCCMYA-1381" /LENGTH=71 /DNA_ID=CAMNT_0012046105 /DNA_START=20 /DNA_END=235 /DNA_ORIENTATION=+